MTAPLPSHCSLRMHGLDYVITTDHLLSLGLKLASRIWIYYMDILIGRSVLVGRMQAREADLVADIHRRCGRHLLSGYIYMVSACATNTWPGLSRTAGQGEGGEGAGRRSRTRSGGSCRSVSLPSHAGIGQAQCSEAATDHVSVAGPHRSAGGSEDETGTEAGPGPGLGPGLGPRPGPGPDRTRPPDAFPRD